MMLVPRFSRIRASVREVAPLVRKIEHGGEYSEKPYRSCSYHVSLLSRHLPWFLSSIVPPGEVGLDTAVQHWALHTDSIIPPWQDRRSLQDPIIRFLANTSR